MSIFETIASVLISIFFLAGAISLAVWWQEKGRERTAAQEIVMIANAALKYAEDNRYEFLHNQNFLQTGTHSTASLSELNETTGGFNTFADSYLNGFRGTNIFGQTYEVYVRPVKHEQIVESVDHNVFDANDYDLRVIVLARGGRGTEQEFQDRIIPLTAGAINGGRALIGAFVPGATTPGSSANAGNIVTSNRHIVLSGAAWADPAGTVDAENLNGNVGISDLAAGTLAVVGNVYRNGSTSNPDHLWRVDDGIQEHHTMYVDLLMGEPEDADGNVKPHSILDVKSVRFAEARIDADGKIRAVEESSDVEGIDCDEEHSGQIYYIQNNEADKQSIALSGLAICRRAPNPERADEFEYKLVPIGDGANTESIRYVTTAQDGEALPIPTCPLGMKPRAFTMPMVFSTGETTHNIAALKAWVEEISDDRWVVRMNTLAKVNSKDTWFGRLSTNPYGAGFDYTGRATALGKEYSGTVGEERLRTVVIGLCSNKYEEF